MNKVNKSKKNLKFSSIAAILSAILIIITILINVAISFFDVKIDMTPNGLYSLNSKTKDYLNGLEKDVDIYFLMDIEDIKNDKDALEVLSLTSILEQYDNFDKVNLVDFDINKNPDMVTELNPDGMFDLKEGDIVVKCGDIRKKVNASEMYVYQYDSNGVMQDATFNGEKLITGAIKAVVENKSPSVYFLTGHGEKSVSKYYTYFEKKLKNVGYKVGELNLSTEEAVPQDAVIIISAAPKTDITTAEMEKLNDFMDNGGNLSLLMSPNQSDEDYANLLEIMHQYCIGMDYNIITETDSSRKANNDESTISVELVDLREQQNSQGSGSIEDLVSGNLNLSNENLTDLTSEVIDSMTGIYPYMTASRSFFDYNGDNYSSLNICPLIQTYDTAESTRYGGNEKVEYVMNPPFYLGAYSEDPTRNDSKLVVMGNAEFIDDEHSAEGYTLVPINLYLSTISWMADSNIDMEIPEKHKTADYMILETKDDTNFILVLLWAAPVVVALSGVAVWLVRRHS